VFDVGFSEIVLIGLIGLVVIGPERLPKLARTLGVYVGKVRRFVTDVRSDVERELHAEELRKSIGSVEGLGDVKGMVDAAREEYYEATSVLDDAHEELSEANESFAELGDDLRASANKAEAAAISEVAHANIVAPNDADAATDLLHADGRDSEPVAQASTDPQALADDDMTVFNPLSPANVAADEHTGLNPKLRESDSSHS
jgi:sec-independent protein translocase protein TatB